MLRHIVAHDRDLTAEERSHDEAPNIALEGKLGYELSVRKADQAREEDGGQEEFPHFLTGGKQNPALKI